MPELTTTVEVDGEEREVSVDVDPGEVDGLVSEDYMSSEIQRRINSATDGLADPDELMEDPDFARRVARRHEDALSEMLGGSGQNGGDPDDGDQGYSEDQIEQLRGEWEDEELRPREERIEELESTTEQLRREKLSREVYQAANRFGAKEQLVELIESHYRGRVEWSDEHNDWFVVNEDGEPIPSNSDSHDLPYRTVQEDLEKKYRSGDYHGQWFDENARPGIDIEGPGDTGSRRSGRVTLEDFQKMTGEERKELKQNNRERWRELQEQRRKQGEEALGISAGGV